MFICFFLGSILGRGWIWFCDYLKVKLFFLDLGFSWVRVLYLFSLFFFGFVEFVFYILRSFVLVLVFGSLGA